MTKTNIEKTLETLVEFADIHRQKLTQLDGGISAVTHQMGTLSENITRLEIQVERIASQVERVASTAAEQSETAKIQARSIDRLITLLERQG